MYNIRLEKLRKCLKLAKAESLLITNINNIYYLSGFSGSAAFLLVTEEKGILGTDFRYLGQAKKQVQNFEIISYEEKTACIKNCVQDTGIRQLGFESEYVSVAFFHKLKNALPGFELQPYANLVEELRQVKDEHEIELLRQAIDITDKTLEELIEDKVVKVGRREKEICNEIEYILRKNGADKAGFDPIVASGPFSAMPHAQPSERRLQEGDFVIVDFGAKHGGYHADLTRTFTLGKASKEQERIYEIVLNAQERAIKTISPGLKCSELDLTARDFIQENGFGEYFGHGLGHGIGLDIHEAPKIHYKNDGILKNNMVFTIEPGIYVPELGGVRIEDVVLVTDKGHEVLTSAGKGKDRS
ncbi:MAG: Xaa-Pro peptidase family protein [bacterium]